MSNGQCWIVVTRVGCTQNCLDLNAVHLRDEKYFFSKYICFCYWLFPCAILNRIRSKNIICFENFVLDFELGGVRLTVRNEEVYYCKLSSVDMLLKIFWGKFWNCWRGFTVDSKELRLSWWWQWKGLWILGCADVDSCLHSIADQSSRCLDTIVLKEMGNVRLFPQFSKW